MSELMPENSVLETEPAAILRAVLNTAVDAIITIDQRGVIRQANPATERLFGYSHAELIGRNISLLMPSPYREEHDGYLRNYLATGNAQIIGIGREVLGRHKSGTLIPVDLAVSESPYNGQRLFTGILRDMSDRKRIETALRRERHFAHDLESTANVIVLLLDSQGRVARFNAFMQHLSGYELSELRGRDWCAALLPAEAHPATRKLFADVVAGAIVDSHVCDILLRDGGRRTIAWAVRRILDSDAIVDGVLAIGTDITDLKATEVKLIQSERLAAIGQMVTGLAHESRNALQRARACLDMLELDAPEQSGQSELIRRAQHALDELQRLYDEVRNYAAPLKLEIESCDLAELCQETWESIQELHSAQQIRLRTELPPDLPTCRCDKSRLQQVLRNIFENACHASPPEGELTVTAVFGGDPESPELQLSIRDQGAGLTEDQALHIFDPFYTTKTKGTGLGMAIVKRIVEAHGGTIRVARPGNSTTGGAEIIFTLPLGRSHG